MAVDFQFRKYCPHCNNTSIQNCLLHHVYDEEKGGLWDGEPETAKKPGVYFIFICKTCEQVLLYHFYPFDNEVEDFVSYIKRGGVQVFPINEIGIEEEVELIWPQVYESIHRYVPTKVKSHYLRALRNIRFPKLFAIELRTTIEKICDDQGIPKRDGADRFIKLGDRLKQLEQKTMLPKSIATVAHKIIKTGNDAAHGADVKPEIILIIRNFFVTLLNHIYVLPLQIHDWDALNPTPNQNNNQSNP